MSIELREKERLLTVQALGEKYEDANDELTGLTKLIISLLPNEFSDIRGTRVKLFFQKTPMSNHDGMCKKLEDSVRFKTGIDYFIVFYKETFDELPRIKKAKLLIHELHHIGKAENGLMIIRKHNEKENFCELESHDLYSDNLVLKIKERLEQPMLEAEIKA